MMKKSLLAVLLICLPVITVLGQSNNTPDKEIKFKKGKSSATVTGAVPRGETQGYLLTAKKNQVMKVTISSIEDNAVFKIKNRTTGYFLSNAGELDDASDWEGTLPSDGEYRIIVGSTRGGSEYTLFVEIK